MSAVSLYRRLGAGDLRALGRTPDPSDGAMMLVKGDVLTLKPNLRALEDNSSLPTRWTVDELTFEPDGTWAYRAHDEHGVVWWVTQAEVERLFLKRMEV